MIGRLDAEGLGRAIAITHQDTDKAAVIQTDVGFSIEQQRGKRSDELVGYSLPLKEDDSQHLVVFKDGTMVVSEPGGIVDIKYYKDRFSANPNPQIYQNQTLAQVIDHYKSPRGVGSKVINVNDREASSEQFNAYIDQALEVASARKAEREQTQRSTMSSFVDKFGAFFRQGEESTLDHTEPGIKPPPTSERPDFPPQPPHEQ